MNDQHLVSGKFPGITGLQHLNKCLSEAKNKACSSQFLLYLPESHLWIDYFAWLSEMFIFLGWQKCMDGLP